MSLSKISSDALPRHASSASAELTGFEALRSLCGPGRHVVLPDIPSGYDAAVVIAAMASLFTTFEHPVDRAMVTRDGFLLAHSDLQNNGRVVTSTVRMSQAAGGLVRRKMRQYIQDTNNAAGRAGVTPRDWQCGIQSSWGSGSHVDREFKVLLEGRYTDKYLPTLVDQAVTASSGDMWSGPSCVWQRVCRACMSLGASKRCSACNLAGTVVPYCNVQCCRNDWARHRLECESRGNASASLHEQLVERDTPWTPSNR